MELDKKHCVPCEGGVQPFVEHQIDEYRSKIDGGWSVEDTRELTREYTFSDFAHALAFVNAVGEIAEAENHHPDLCIHGYRHVRISLSTHAIGGLSENDFILAAKIDSMPESDIH